MSFFLFLLLFSLFFDGFVPAFITPLLPNCTSQAHESKVLDANANIYLEDNTALIRFAEAKFV